MGSSRHTVSHGTIRRCADCGHAFMESVPSVAELAELYRHMDTAIYEAETAAREKTASRHAAMVCRYATAGELLDVGCASGLFLERAASSGWRVTGIEPAERLCAVAAARLGGRGRILNKLLQKADLLSDTFDAVTLWDVLEHVAEPVAFLARCATLLKPAGLLFAKVPDVESLQARLMGRRWPLYLAEHLGYFTRRSLRWCGERAGLQVLRFERNPVSFSVEYVSFRMSQHRLPGASLAYCLLRGSRLGKFVFPLPLGERHAVLQKPRA